MDKERFKGLCLEILPLIDGIMEAVKRNGYEGMSSLVMDNDGYFSFNLHENNCSMKRGGEGLTKIHFEYNEEIQMQERKNEDE